MARATGGETYPLALTTSRKMNTTLDTMRRESARGDVAAQRGRILCRRPLERFQGFGLRAVHVEKRPPLRPLQQIAHSLGQVRQLNRGTSKLCRGMQRYQRSQSARIDIGHF